MRGCGRVWVPYLVIAFVVALAAARSPFVTEQASADVRERERLAELVGAVQEYRMAEGLVVAAAALREPARVAAAEAEFVRTRATVDEQHAPLFAGPWQTLRTNGVRVVELARAGDVATMRRLFDGPDRLAYEAAVAAVLAGLSEAETTEPAWLSPSRLLMGAVLLGCAGLCGAVRLLMRGARPARAPTALAPPGSRSSSRAG